ncbi:hypothetical protein GO988_00055 [Hymenobacter sp. HMF4947]|uniref:Uncharacterized protein n=1 Tax=Hymenobacter ginkgonis TaxID=2682976 RepID=A0A7K1T8K1_9BACT|nr:hypothetical protein [Hymenobacter ginkgonis]MVN74713.1 hypothetical protein [Hymenobacter ginkgonis]
MAISLDSLYAPVNDFFLKKFQSTDGSPMLFRFDQYGIKISDEDYDPAAHNVQEVFSDLVNRMPILSTDAATVIFIDKPIDEYYHQIILKPSLPSLPPGADESTRESLQNTFASLKNEAIRDYEDTYSQARGGGTGGEVVSAAVPELFRLSTPTPRNWYDRTNAEIWEKYSFSITDDPAKAPPVSQPVAPKPLWKLRLNDAQMAQLMPALVAPEPVKPTVLLNNVKLARLNAFSMIQPVAAAAPAPAAKPAIANMAFHNVLAHGLNAPVALTTVKPALQANALLLNSVEGTPTRTPVQQRFHSAFDRLRLLDKINLTNAIKDVAPTQPVSTNTININFDYCLVRIDRGWFSSLFVDNRNWYIPGYKRGELSASEGGLAVIPSAMLLVKNLRLTANWSGDDLNNIKAATAFGPFNVDAQQDTSTDVGHDGIQVVGWLLQKLPTLPSNDPPS